MLRLNWAFALILLCVIGETHGYFLVGNPNWFPHLGFLVVVFAALHGGVRSGLPSGVWMGFLTDIMSLEKFGTFTFIYAALGIVCGTLKGKVFADSFASQCLIPAGAYLGVLAATAMMALPGGEWDVPQLLDRVLWHSSLIATVVFSPFVFHLLKVALYKQQAPSRYIFLE